MVLSGVSIQNQQSGSAQILPNMTRDLLYQVPHMSALDRLLVAKLLMKELNQFPNYSIEYQGLVHVLLHIRGFHSSEELDPEISDTVYRQLLYNIPREVIRSFAQSPIWGQTHAATIQSINSLDSFERLLSLAQGGRDTELDKTPLAQPRLAAFDMLKQQVAVQQIRYFDELKEGFHESQRYQDIFDKSVRCLAFKFVPKGRLKDNLKQLRVENKDQVAAIEKQGHDKRKHGIQRAYLNLDRYFNRSEWMREQIKSFDL